MKSQLQPWHLLLLILAGWINRRQQAAVEYLLTENQILREKLGKKRILLNDYERRRLAIKGKILGRRVLDELATIVTPETIMRWHRKLVAAHWDIASAGNTPDARRSHARSLSWCCAWLRKIRHGTLTASREPERIRDSPFPIGRSAIS